MEEILNKVLQDFSSLKSLPDELKKRIRSRARELPSMISSFGLRTVMYFYYSKSGRECLNNIKSGKSCESQEEEAYGRLYLIMEKYVKEILNIKTEDYLEVLKELNKFDNEIKAQAYMELPLNYLKRIIEAEFEESQNG